MRNDSKIQKLKLLLKSHWKQFCLNTSLHGWQYTAFPNTSKFERYIWIIICLTALGASIFLMASQWLQFQENPIITVTESTQYSIYKFMFPAVTICSFNKISKSASYQMAKKLESNSSNIDYLAKTLKLLIYLVNTDNYSIPQQEYEYMQKVLKDKGKTEMDIFKIISPPCDKIIKKCMWKGEDKKCNLMFETVKTPIGYCCSFNYYALKKSVHINKTNTGFIKFSKSPRRTSACGYQSGLEVLIDNDPEDYFATIIPSIGVRVLIHNPFEFPNWGVPNILCEIDTNNFIGINPEIITATKNIKARSFQDRKCVFPFERSLDNFAEYTFHNCMVECRMLLILELCGCVPFYVYNKEGNYSTRRKCTLKDNPCIAESEYNMYNTSLIEKMKKEKDIKCNCLTACEITTYVAEASKGILDATYCTNQFSIFSDVNLENKTIVRVFFNDLLGTRHRRDVLFTWHTLMGYYGGILGLFTGFSFISLVEIVYFTVIRCLTNSKIKQKIDNQSEVPQDKLWG